MFGRIGMKRSKRKMFELEQDLLRKLQKRLTEFPGKRDRVRGLGAYSYPSKVKSYSPLDFKVAPRQKLFEIFERNKKYLEDAKSQSEVMDALSNLDADIKAFRDEYYPKMSPVDRLEYEEIIEGIYKILEGYARRKFRKLGRDFLDRILEF
jgi:hypothetical protein